MDRGNRRAVREPPLANSRLSRSRRVRGPGKRGGRLGVLALFLTVLVGIWCAISFRSLFHHLPTVAWWAVPFERSSAAPDPTPREVAARFDGGAALDLAKRLSNLGQRHPESTPHTAAIALLRAELARAGWICEVERFSDPSAGPKMFTNLIARHVGRDRRTDRWRRPEIFLVARYDSPQVHFAALPAASDAAAGPALLCALASALGHAPKISSRITICLVDGSSPLEQFSAVDGLRGSRVLAASLERLAPGGISAVVVVHAVGTTPPRLTIPPRSSPALTRALRDIVQDLKLPLAIETLERPAWDDDLPLLAPGRKVLLLHDGDALHLGTGDDTADKLSSDSFTAVGVALIHLLTEL